MIVQNKFQIYDQLCESKNRKCCEKAETGIPEQQMQAISFVMQSMIPPLRIKVLERKFRNLKQAVLQPLKESRATKALKQNRYLQETNF